MHTGTDYRNNDLTSQRRHREVRIQNWWQDTRCTPRGDWKNHWERSDIWERTHRPQNMSRPKIKIVVSKETPRS